MKKVYLYGDEINKLVLGITTHKEYKGLYIYEIDNNIEYTFHYINRKNITYKTKLSKEIADKALTIYALTGNTIDIFSYLLNHYTKE